MNGPKVLVVGAGPTGLLLTLSLARQGIPVRIVDKKPGPAEHSRALVVHARTLELYAQLGIANEVVEVGVPVEKVHILQADGRGDEVVPLRNIGKGLSPFPNVVCYPQDAHEKLLIQKVREAGVEIGWDTRLTELSANEEGARATLEHDGGQTETVDAAYVCGCDGGRSRVREALEIGFEGGSYDRSYFVVDASIRGADPRDIRLSFDPKILALGFPVRPGEARLLGVTPDALMGKKDLSFEDVRGDLESLLRLEVEKVNWFSAFKIHHRVAEHFRVGRCFLAGDAGHVHSPLGGQGMNTGLGDAYNLAWKLALVIQGRAPSALLDTYEPERIAFARTLVSTTDTAFQHLVGSDLGSRLTRSAAPRVVPFLFNFEALRRTLFKTISQISIRYPDSALSEGAAGEVRGGDRLPWLAAPKDEGLGNFAVLTARAFQLHVYGVVSEELSSAARELGLPVHAFDWNHRAHEKGFGQDSALVVRPDGYVGLALERQKAAALRAYVARNGLSFGEARARPVTLQAGIQMPQQRVERRSA